MTFSHIHICLFEYAYCRNPTCTSNRIGTVYLLLLLVFIHMLSVPAFKYNLGLRARKSRCRYSPSLHDYFLFVRLSNCGVHATQLRAIEVRPLAGLEPGERKAGEMSAMQ